MNDPKRLVYLYTAGSASSVSWRVTHTHTQTSHPEFRSGVSGSTHLQGAVTCYMLFRRVARCHRDLLDPSLTSWVEK